MYIYTLLFLTYPILFLWNYQISKNWCMLLYELTNKRLQKIINYNNLYVSKWIKWPQGNSGFPQYPQCRTQGLSGFFSVSSVPTSGSLGTSSVPSVQTSGLLRVYSVPFRVSSGFFDNIRSFFVTVVI